MIHQKQFILKMYLIFIFNSQLKGHYRAQTVSHKSCSRCNIDDVYLVKCIPKHFLGHFFEVGCNTENLNVEGLLY